MLLINIKVAKCDIGFDIIRYNYRLSYEIIFLSQ